MVPLTKPLEAIGLDSADVLAVFANPNSPVIMNGSRLFTEI